MNDFINAIPDFVCSNVLSRSSRSCWTWGANSEPNVAVAIKQPPPFDEGISIGSGISLTPTKTSVAKISSVLFPTPVKLRVINEILSFEFTLGTISKSYR